MRFTKTPSSSTANVLRTTSATVVPRRKASRYINTLLISTIEPKAKKASTAPKGTLWANDSATNESTVEQTDITAAKAIRRATAAQSPPPSSGHAERGNNV